MEPLTRTNTKWLERLNQHFEQHLSDTNFTQVQLAQLMNISTRQLNRKVRQLTGLSPREHLKQARYDKALELLESRRYDTVAETAYAVGLKDVVHFSRQFRERYGTRPSEFLK